MPCPINDCQRLFLDDEKYASLNNNQLAKEVMGMRGRQYREWPTRVVIKEQELTQAINSQWRIVFGSCAALLTVGVVGALCFKATLLIAVASLPVIATALLIAALITRRSNYCQLRAVIDQIKAGRYQGAMAKIKPYLQDSFTNARDPLYLNRNAALFKDWVEKKVDRSHYNAGVHFDSFMGTAMLIDAHDQIQKITKEAQFEALRHDIKPALKLASMRRQDENLPFEKAFAYVVLHRSLADVKAILKGAEEQLPFLEKKSSSL